MRISDWSSDVCSSDLLFIVTGPGSPSVKANMVTAIEQHIEWISDCLVHLDRNGFATIEPTADAEGKWVRHVNAVANSTLFPRATNSWYVGANIPGKPRVFLPESDKRRVGKESSSTIR